MTPVVRVVIGAAIGAGVGYLAHRFIGCRTGACPLYGNPWLAMAIWGLAGAVAAGGR